MHLKTESQCFEISFLFKSLSCFDGFWTSKIYQLTWWNENIIVTITFYLSLLSFVLPSTQIWPFQQTRSGKKVVKGYLSNKCCRTHMGGFNKVYSYDNCVLFGAYDTVVSQGWYLSLSEDRYCSSLHRWLIFEHVTVNFLSVFQ